MNNLKKYIWIKKIKTKFGRTINLMTDLKMSLELRRIEERMMKKRNSHMHCPIIKVIPC